MNPEEIYQALNKINLSASHIAEALGVRPQTVSSVIREGKGSKRVAKAVAISLEVSIEQVFPFYAEKRNKKEKKQNDINRLKDKFSSLTI